MTKSVYLVLAVLMLSIHTSMAYTPNEIITKIKPYMTAAYAVNPNSPMVTSQNMNGAVYIYKLPVTPAVFVFSSSGAIDCDGGTTAICKTDTQGQSQTSFTQSNGQPLNAATLPFYVLPETPNAIFDYAKNNIQGGETGVIIYNDKMTYGIFGDERGLDHNGGADTGEMSYGACIALGQSTATCNPNTGGIDSGVTYIVFTTPSNVASPLESTSSAQTKGSSALDVMMSQLVSSPTPTPTPQATNNVNIAGWRSSAYGYQTGSPPSYWVNVAKAMASKFPGTTPGGIWLVGETDGSPAIGTLLYMPSNGSYPNIRFQGADIAEPYLTAFDAAGLKVILQVEPMNADINTLIGIVMNRYKQHPSVIGFGVDNEWYKTCADGCVATAAEVTSWDNTLHAINPNYILMIKHFDESHLPSGIPTDILIVDDSEQNGNLNSLVGYFKSFFSKYPNNPIAAQIGYPSDKSGIWGSMSDPAKQVGNAIQAGAGRPMSVFWVDFSITSVFPTSIYNVGTPTPAPTSAPISGTIFFDNVEFGSGSWTSSGLWHITTRRSNSSSNSWWYGKESTGNNYTRYNSNSGSLISPTISLVGSSRPILSFMSWYRTDRKNDIKIVQISTDGGNKWITLKQISDKSSNWNQKQIDLINYVGKTIQIRFYFDTVDSLLNKYEGWYIDDVKVD